MFDGLTCMRCTKVSLQVRVLVTTAAGTKWHARHLCGEDDWHARNRNHNNFGAEVSKLWRRMPDMSSKGLAQQGHWLMSV